MKKILCVLVLICLVFGAAFAQQKPAANASNNMKNSVGLDLFQMFKGFVASDNDDKYICFIVSASYERLIASNFSVGADADMYFLSFDSTPGLYFSLAAEGRYYPAADFDKFFLGTTVGFNLLSIDGSSRPKDGGFFGLITSLKVGYKLVISNNIYLEPSLAYVLSKSASSAIPTPRGWNGGLRFGLMF